MSHNTTKYVKLPFSNAKMKAHNSKVVSNVSGSGMGSVLLQKGGPGSASSYLDIDDYIATTGVNPYARAGIKPKKLEGKGGFLENKSMSTGLANLSKKLSKLSVVPEGPKRKNITMSF